MSNAAPPKPLQGRLTLDELDITRDAVLVGIETRGEVWEIGDESSYFVLGPPDLMGQVLGLYDEEYGWPELIDADGPIESFVPRHRSHPMIQRNGKVVAGSVSAGEFLDILKASGSA
jgi:hypothetical protein